MKAKALYLFALSVLSLGGWLSAGLLLSRLGAYWPIALAIVMWLAISALALAATRVRHSPWIYAGLLVLAMSLLLPLVLARILPEGSSLGFVAWWTLPSMTVPITLLLYSGLASRARRGAGTVEDEGPQAEHKQAEQAEQAEQAAVVLVLSALTLVCWWSSFLGFGFGRPLFRWLIALAVVLLSVSVLTLAARKASHKVWVLAALPILASLFLPASLLVKLPGPPAGDPLDQHAMMLLLMLSVALVAAALLLHSGLNLLRERQKMGPSEGGSSHTQRKHAGKIGLCVLALSLPLLAKTLHNWYWFMVWDTTTDSLGYFWLALPVLAALFSGVVLSIVLPGRTKWAGVLYSVLISALLIGISARAQRVHFRQLTEERAERVTQALEAYYAREGHYPQDLRQLIPWYILSVHGPVIIYGQGWCYDGREDYYRLGYVSREHWSDPLLTGRVYKTRGETPGLPGICDEEITALIERFPSFARR